MTGVSASANGVALLSTAELQVILDDMPITATIHLDGLPSSTFGKPRCRGAATSGAGLSGSGIGIETSGAWPPSRCSLGRMHASRAVHARSRESRSHARRNLPENVSTAQQNRQTRILVEYKNSPVINALRVLHGRLRLRHLSMPKL
jgi:hypothetical protein